MADGTAQQQQQERFLEVVNDHQRILRKVCRLYGDDPADRDDLRQEILLQLWRAFPSFRGEAAVSTWIYRVALNTALLGRRKRRPAASVPVSEDFPAPPEPDPERDLELQALYACIRELPPVDRAIVLLYLEDLSYDEIAGVTGLGRSAVSVRIVRIKKRLERCLAERGFRRE